MKGRVLYKETQIFRGTFFWWLQTLLISAIVGGLILGKVLLVFESDWLDGVGLYDAESILAVLIALIVLGAVLWLLTVIKMEVEIDEGGLYYSYFPFVSSKKLIQKSHLLSMKVRKYSPIMEYGGWGYRRSFKNGKALNVGGKYGLQLVFKDGKKLLLGTRKPGELQRIVELLNKKWGMQ
ncbi:MAG: hypothetical protein RJQ14_06080 [Marinoscillum sp.]